MCSKLLLDHAGEWHRTAKSIQVHQDNAENQIYSNSCQTDRTHEGLFDRNQEISLELKLFPIQPETLENISPDTVQSTLPRLDLPQAPFDSKSEYREEIAESLCTDGTAPLEMPEENEGNTPYTPGSRKSTRKNFGKPASSSSDFYM